MRWVRERDDDISSVTHIWIIWFWIGLLRGAHVNKKSKQKLLYPLHLHYLSSKPPDSTSALPMVLNHRQMKAHEQARMPGLRPPVVALAQPRREQPYGLSSCSRIGARWIWQLPGCAARGGSGDGPGARRAAAVQVRAPFVADGRRHHPRVTHPHQWVCISLPIPLTISLTYPYPRPHFPQSKHHLRHSFLF